MVGGESRDESWREGVVVGIMDREMLRAHSSMLVWILLGPFVYI